MRQNRRRERLRSGYERKPSGTPRSSAIRGCPLTHKASGRFNLPKKLPFSVIADSNPADRVTKRYIYGTRSLPATSIRLLAELGIESHALPAGHWVMIDAAPEFYRLLRSFILAGEWRGSSWELSP